MKQLFTPAEVPSENRINYQSKELRVLHDVYDLHSFKAVECPIHAKFTCLKSGHFFPSIALLKIANTAEIMFKKRKLWQEKRLTSEKNLDLKILHVILKQPSPGVFNQYANHFFQSTFRAECNHLTSLL